MDPKLKIALFFFDLILPMAFGYALAHSGRVKKEFFDRMILVGIIALGTPLALISCWNVQPDWNVIWLPLLGVVMLAAPGFAGLLRAGSKFDHALERGSYLLSSILANRGAVGSLTVYILYQEEGYAYYRLVVLLAPVVVYCFCFPVASYFYAAGTGRESGRPSLRSLVLNVRQFPALGVIVGLVLAFSRVPRPEVLGQAFHVAFHPTVWVFVIPVGASLHLGRMTGYLRRVAELLPLKFLVAPLATAAAAWAVGIDGNAFMSVVILAASPTAISAVTTSRLFKLNVDVAMAGLILTTTVYLAVAIPVLLFLM